MCDCQGFCEKCSVSYRLYKKCPPDQESCDVTSNDIQVDLSTSGSNREVVPVRYTDSKGNEEDPILIMKLSRNQIVDFLLIAKKGIGRTHAKWSPVATCIMRAEPIVELLDNKLNTELTVAQRNTLIERCPRKVYRLDDLKLTVEIEDVNACNLCNECIKYTKDINVNNAIRIDESENKFIFTVESTGALPPEDIVIKALKVLSQKLKTIQELI